MKKKGTRITMIDPSTLVGKGPRGSSYICLRGTKDTTTHQDTEYRVFSICDVDFLTCPWAQGLANLLVQADHFGIHSLNDMGRSDEFLPGLILLKVLQ